MLFVHREKGLFLSVYVDDMKLANQHLSLIMKTWDVLKDNVK